jgi:Holliday junction resolvasome RuvABC ATP-dependent DNA helicase subunit
LDAAKRSQIMFIDRIHSVSHAAQAAMADALEGVQFHGNNSSSFWAG